jgi:predicted transglutaminase-like cysteine proteinase
MFGRGAAWCGAVWLVVIWLAVLVALVPVRSAIEQDRRGPAIAPAIVADLIEPFDRETERDNAWRDMQPGGSAQRPETWASREPVAPAMASPPVAAEPFGFTTRPVASGDVIAKWQTVTARVAADNETLARCQTGAQPCPAAAQKFLAIIRQGREANGRARIGIVNRAINLAIEPMSDMAQWGVADRWSPPLETLATGRGDCEDYAIAKYVALTAAGIAPEDVKLVIVHDKAVNEDHAMTAVRLDGAWVMLDNRRLTLVADNAMREVVPLFMLGTDGVWKFTRVPILAGALSAPQPASL